jgi:hypothetical protein
MRISPLLRMQPKTSSFMLETISRTVARSDTMLGKEYNVRTPFPSHNSRMRVRVRLAHMLFCFRLFLQHQRSLSKFSSSTMFKPPMSKDILPSQTEEEEDRTSPLNSPPVSRHARTIGQVLTRGLVVIASLSVCVVCVCVCVCVSVCGVWCVCVCLCCSCVRVLRATIRG